MEDYAEAVKVLNGRTSRKVGNNTYMNIDPRTGDISVRLHNTDVVTFGIAGSIIVKTGGWRTVTTKGRINAYIPRRFQVYSQKGAWFASKDRIGYWDDSNGGYVPNPNMITVEFEDGMDLSTL